MSLRVTRAMPKLALVRGAMAGVVTAFALQPKSDTDLWGHVRYGIDVLTSLKIPVADHYSFTSDQAWINHEWLAEVLMGSAYRAYGPIGLKLLLLGAVLSAVILARWSLSRTELSDWSVELVTGAVFLIGVAPLAQTLRPQTFSALLFVVLLTIVRESDRGNPRVLVMLSALFFAWANIHGAWVMAAGVLAVWTCIRLVEASTFETRRWMAMCVVAAGAATLLNPYGLELWRFLATTVRLSRSDVAEWGSVASAPLMLIPWTLTSAVVAARVRQFRRQDTAYLAICVMLAVASLRVIRLMPFFSIAALMLLPPPLSLPAVRSRPSLTRRGWVAAAMVWLICVGSTARGQAQVGCLQPVAGLQVDESAAEFLRENHVSGRLVVWFNWGEYVSWHFGRELTISMDGRRETVYSKQLLDAHNDFYGGGEGARAFLERLAPDYIWLPNTLPVSSQLDAWGWKAVYQTNVSTIWARTPDPAARPARSWRLPNRSLSSCFPFASASTSPSQKS